MKKNRSARIRSIICSLQIRVYSTVDGVLDLVAASSWKKKIVANMCLCSELDGGKSNKTY